MYVSKSLGYSFYCIPTVTAAITNYTLYLNIVLIILYSGNKVLISSTICFILIGYLDDHKTKPLSNKAKLSKEHLSIISLSNKIFCQKGYLTIIQAIILDMKKQYISFSRSLGLQAMSP